MTEQELRKLRRVDLLEILLDLSKENEVLRTQLEKTRTQLASRTIAIEKSGTLAEAVLRVNGVFEAAQAACEQYTLNLQQRVEKQEEICQEMEQSTREKCERMLREAQEEAEALRTAAQQEAETGLLSARQEAEDLRASAQEEASGTITAAQQEADAIRAAAQQEADTVRKEAAAYREEAEKAVKDMVDSYSWLTKVLN